MKELLSVNQLALLWKLHPITIRRYIREGKLPAVKVGGRIRIKKSAAAKMAKTFHVLPKKPKPAHLSQRPSHRTFSETDPLWRLKGTASGLKQ